MAHTLPFGHAATGSGGIVIANDLSIRDRAELFAQLAVMEESGLPFSSALGLLARAPGELRARAAAAAKLASAGTDLASAAERSRLFTRLEVILLRAALSAGSPAALYRRLADYYTRKSLLQAKLRAKLLLPGLTFVATLLLAPLPALVGGRIGIGDYVLRTLLWLGGAALAGAVLKSLPDALLRALPFVGPLREREQVRDYFENLAMMLEAGLPMLDALPKAASVVEDGALRARFAAMERRVRKGETFAQALAALPARWVAQVEPYAGAGEASGSLPESLFRFCAIESDAIALHQGVLADWLPRLAYVAAAAYAALQILGSGAFMLTSSRNFGTG